MYPPRLPCPYLRWDIIVDARRGQLALDEFGNLQVERRVVDENENVGVLS